MKYRHSLRNRIVIAFCVFGCVLSMTYWLLLDASMSLVEDMVFENRLKNEIDGYLFRYSIDPAATLPYSTYIRGYIGTAGMPETHRKMVENLSEGFYETDGPNAIPGLDDYHVAVKRLPDQRGILYLFFDVGTVKVNEKYELIATVLLFGISFIVTAAGAGIGLLIAKKVIEPVTELSDRVAKSAPGELPVDLAGRFADDEVGFLARNLEESMRRIQRFIRREQEFTRDASHELRTPMTVIKGAVELIQQQPAYGEKSIFRPVNRIERAAHGMALTIDTFLWLAREDTGSDVELACDIGTVVRDAVSEHRSIFREKAIRVEVAENAAPVIRAPATVFRIVIDNLLRNAFQHTASGTIRMTVMESGIELFNTAHLDLPGDDLSAIQPNVRGKESGGFGLGLDIVERLCERFGWRLDIRGAAGSGTIVTLGFL